MLKKHKAAHLSKQTKLCSVKAPFTVGSKCQTETETTPQCLLFKGEHKGIVLRHVTFLSSEFQKRVATRAGFGLSRPQDTGLRDYE